VDAVPTSLWMVPRLLVFSLKGFSQLDVAQTSLGYFSHEVSGVDFVTVFLSKVHFCTAHSSQLSVWRVNCSPFSIQSSWSPSSTIVRLILIIYYYSITLLRHHHFADRFLLLYSMVLKPGFTGSFILSPTHLFYFYRFLLLYSMVLKPGFTGSFILSPTHLFYFYSFIAKLLQGLITNLNLFNKGHFCTVKPLITNTSKEFMKCRILHFLIMECCRYLVFLIKWLYGTL